MNVQSVHYVCTSSRQNHSLNGEIIIRFAANNVLISMHQNLFTFILSFYLKLSVVDNIATMKYCDIFKSFLYILNKIWQLK